ncbi:MAG: bifunctional pyr operon transcriptional regulator/uracil phosphoribosyltransferase PyrR [Lentisphaeria bacterium]|nr:bifunctional pyr operon transcriptional regulator/uracil phosphoribosyltransferase PyrR [Lentisphaeria bacterium]
MVPDKAEDRQHLMEAGEIASLIRKLGEMICSDNRNVPDGQLILIGIQRGGVPLAERLVQEIRNRSGVVCPCGTLDIAMYRDDIGMRKTLPQILETRIPFDITGKTIILVDDVLQSGRSIRAALDAITYFGRPAVVRLAVLLDRGSREFPIQGDYVGSFMEVPKERRIRVNWHELTGTGDFVYSAPTPKIKESI